MDAIQQNFSGATVAATTSTPPPPTSSPQRKRRRQQIAGNHKHNIYLQLVKMHDKCNKLHISTSYQL